MRFEHVATLRFAFGLPAAAIALLVLGAPAFASRHDSWYIALLAVVTGFIALGLYYYYGLRTTPAVAATIAELAFPISAILVGLLQVRPDAHGLAVGRCRNDEPRRRAAARASARPGRDRAEPRARTCVMRVTICATSARATACRTSPTRSSPLCVPSSSPALPLQEWPRIEAGLVRT